MKINSERPSMKIAIALAAALISLSASAQEYRENINNYVPGIANQAPNGATGPGVVYTQRMTGRIIAVGAAVTKAVVVGQFCQGSPGYQNQPQSGLNTGKVLGTIAGVALGNQIGRGDGKTAATVIGGIVGGEIGDDRNRGVGGQWQQGSNCQLQYEHQILGYSFIAQYEHIQMQGFMRRQPQVGETVEIIVRSVFYAGS